jgi:small subunit ribosomal protein S4
VEKFKEKSEKKFSEKVKPTSDGKTKKDQKSSGKKLSEYGLQLREKQQVKRMYGVLEKQFRRFFAKAGKAEGSAGENLLSLLERRLDNVIYRLKFAATRPQARQMVVHGHILVNGKKVTAPSFLVSVDDIISLSPSSLEQENFVKQVVDKRLNIGIKVPDWLELNKKDYKGNVLRLPIRTDIQAPIEEHLIVELYSK